MRHAAISSRRLVAAALTAFAIPLALSLTGDAAGQGTTGKKDAGAPAASASTASSSSAPTASSDAGAAAPAASSSAATSGDGGAPSTTSSAAPVAASAPDSGMDGATYTVRLRDLEAKVDELKDQIRRSHNRLAMLSDTILSGGLAGSRAEINFDNEMSSAFRLVKAVFVVG